MRPSTIKHLYDIGLGGSSPALRPGSIKVKRTAEAAGITSIQNGTLKTSSLVETASSYNKENVSETKKPKEESLLSTPKRKALPDKSSISLAYYAEPEGELYCTVYCYLTVKTCSQGTDIISVYTVYNIQCYQVCIIEYVCFPVQRTEL